MTVTDLPWEEIAEYAKTNSLRFCWEMTGKVCALPTFVKESRRRGILTPKMRSMRSKFTKEDIATIARMRADGAKSRDIAKAVGKSRERIESYCKEFGVKHGHAVRMQRAMDTLSAVKWADVFEYKNQNKRKPVRVLRDLFAPGVSEWSFAKHMAANKPVVSEEKRLRLDAFMPPCSLPLLKGRMVHA